MSPPLSRHRRRAGPGRTLAPTLVAVCLSLVPAVTGAAAAQDAPEDLAQEAAERVQELRTLDSQIARLHGLAARGDEGGAPLQRRLVEYQGQRRDVLWALVDLAQEAGDDPAVSRVGTMADSLLAAELGVIVAEAEAANERVTALRSAREGAAPADLLELEHRIGRADQAMDRAVAQFVENLERMEARGLPLPPGVETLDQLLLGSAETALEEMDEATEEAATLRDVVASAGATPPDGADLRIRAADLRLANAAAQLEAVLDLLDQRGVETTAYREELVVRSGSLSAEDLDVAVLTQLVQRGWANLRGWVATNGGSVLFRVLLFVGILFLFRILAGAVRKLVARAVSTSRLNLSTLLQKTFVDWAGRLVWLLGILIALAQVGVDLAPVLAGLGVAGFIVGFALQDTLSNFAAGMMILIYRPFDVNDLVEAGGQFGTVSAMSLVSTTILTLDNQRLVVPNSQIWGGVIRNMTAERIRRVDMVFGIGYADDIPGAEAVLNRILDEHPKVLDDPEAVVRVHTLNESSVDFVVRPWCATADYWDVYWDVTKAVKMTFDAEGISIPFPQRDVHLFPAGDGDQAPPPPPAPAAAAEVASPDSGGSDPNENEAQ